MKNIVRRDDIWGKKRGRCQGCGSEPLELTPYEVRAEIPGEAEAEIRWLCGICAGGPDS